MAPTDATLPPTVDEDDSLPTAGIIFIAIGAYIVIFTLGILIRQCLLARGLSICPEWVHEMCCTTCACMSCVGIAHCAELCDFNVPTKRSCLDCCCPTKERCDEMFCCCMNQLPGGTLCDDCAGPECQCGDCNCACNCQLPECNSINCICFEIQLKQPGYSGNAQANSGYYGQYPGQNVAYPGQNINYGQQLSHTNPQA
ncbi:uncharacterized protein LOC114523619 [Dendronephthya gigantea]|uniref:uncharacterized protein LOC114523619 n=1 Tax=Dendronephthya gigantea TaxID=151771 RepID=UPI00106D8EFF|nr:uncharacterized protein LOC114523619 [Dendronephthya gigantea]